IRGEVSIFRGGAGGLSYFSSGSFRGTLYVGASWAEALASPDNKTRQMKKLVFDIIKHLKLKKADRISEHTRGVHQIFSTQNRGRGMGSYLIRAWPKSHILEKSAFFEGSNHPCRRPKRTQVNLPRHVFLAFANGGLATRPPWRSDPICDFLRLSDLAYSPF